MFYGDQFSLSFSLLRRLETMALKNFSFQKNWVGIEVPGMKVTFFAIFDSRWAHVLAPMAVINCLVRISHPPQLRIKKSDIFRVEKWYFNHCRQVVMQTDTFFFTQTLLTTVHFPLINFLLWDVVDIWQNFWICQY